MGACDFYEVAQGKTAREAFQRAVEDAQYESGHGGYTGTIAEKGGDGFKMIRDSSAQVRARMKEALKETKEDLKRVKKGGEVPREKYWDQGDIENHIRCLQDRIKSFPRTLTPMDIAHALMFLDDKRIRDKWGACGCIDMTPKLTGKRKRKSFLFFGLASS
jgi:hypothetical protein